MLPLETPLNPNNPGTAENEIWLRGLTDALHQTLKEIESGGGDLYQKRHCQRGRLLPRDRIRAVLDEGSPFIELSSLAAYQVYPEPVAAAGIISGIGYIHQFPCMIVANDPTVKGGSYYPLTVKKHLRAQAIAMKNRLPCVYLVDSGGANLPYQAEVFPDRDHFGRIFYNQARMSAEGIPQIAVVMGPCTAGGAYIPAMADQTIMVKQQGTIYLGGPPLVKAATGERVTAEELGGAELHCQHSGVADYLAENDLDALQQARDCLQPLLSPVPPLHDTHPPRYAISELYSLIPRDMRQPVDMRSLIARLVDDSEFDEFKRLFGRTLITGFASLYGQPVGIIANNGILFSDSAQKGCQFVQLCCQRQIPLLFIQNITGFMVGRKYEQEGIAKHGAKMVTAVACAEVPKLTLIVGGSYGAGNYAMCGRAYDPDFLFTWPSARIAVMGGQQAASVLSDVRRERLKQQNLHEDQATTDAYHQQISDRFDEQSHPYYASARLWDDGIIDPAATRFVLGHCLHICMLSPRPQSRFGIFRI
ncbi:carboxyl transferase domain-containing protein [Neptuniibacter sp. CAU 1671]|uniref:carboxyl transferase domain-containing protein n=1 Tax=Neptuniibacter sp. CAU 1671 TaxID=3032593 RepID=UPI0023D97D9C|nr:carboxyl transferase domain-containing protein [Neptuniibacter sp. CAU 1671]MDF2180878.1 carboxyl transferase domain-containing protein [Neptuniibacter sp. CAU 1671]